MKQITRATDAIARLKTARIPQDAHGVTFVLYAPGDSTLYRVALVTLWPAEAESELPAQLTLLVTMNDDTIVITRPRDEFTWWTPERFITRFTDRRMGWWPAVRPLLATLRWTAPGDRSTEFSPADWTLIAQAAN